MDGRIVEFEPVVVTDDVAQWRGPFPGYLLDDAAAAAWESMTRDAQARSRFCSASIIANRLRCASSVGYRDQQAADLQSAVLAAQESRRWWIMAAVGEAVFVLLLGTAAVVL